MASETQQTPSLHPPSFTSYSSQSQSPLFTTLPPELRHQIFTYALTSTEDTDPQRAYSKETYWTRPGYSAPRKTHTALLRTCKLAYAEGWFMPFAFAEHVFYLTGHDRAPGRLKPAEFEEFLNVIHAVHSERERAVGRKGIATGPIRIFAQLYILEPGNALQELFDIANFAPKQITLTIRYTDFWYWERNERLYINAKWVNQARFPNSVTRFTMDFESLERRKEEIDLLVEQAVERWGFLRKDGGILRATREDVSVSRWTGSSMFGGRRWVRDEDPAKPGVLSYYVVSVTWKIDRSSLVVDNTKGGGERVVLEDVPNIRVPHDFVQISPPLSEWTSLTESEMRLSGVGMDLPAEEAVAAVRAFRMNSVTARVRRRQGLRIPGGDL
ncbi:hypothetical protein BJX63DRAFT_397220 [Aspergillus granulosus]|uniref:2EXR domain-containing protein n=1 Tax=Aspergillus granulosus TaxID=176169 RepID=A0ABR4H9U0_9EURO